MWSLELILKSIEAFEVNEDEHTLKEPAPYLQFCKQNS